MKDDFEELWQKYVNTQEVFQKEERNILIRALAASETILQATRIFHATSSRENYISQLPSLALTRMMELVRSVADARQVYTLASLKTKFHRYRYPLRENEARALLDRFRLSEKA